MEDQLRRPKMLRVPGRLEQSHEGLSKVEESMILDSRITNTQGYILNIISDLRANTSLTWHRRLGSRPCCCATRYVYFYPSTHSACPAFIFATLGHSLLVSETLGAARCCGGPDSFTCHSHLHIYYLGYFNT